MNDHDWFWTLSESEPEQTVAGIERLRQLLMKQPKPKSIRRIIRIQKNTELANRWHTVCTDPEAVVLRPDKAGYVSTWCSCQWPDNENEFVEYDSDEHDQLECRACRTKMYNWETGYIGRGAKLWLRDGALEVSYQYNPHRVEYRLFHTAQTQHRMYEDEMLTCELGDRVVRQYVHQNSFVKTLLRMTWEMSPATVRAKEAYWAKQNEAREQKGNYWYQHNVMNPRWVTTRKQNYRHVLLGYGDLSPGEEGFRNIACPNRVVIHRCNEEEMALPICPYCQDAIDAVIEKAELELPDGRKLPKPNKLPAEEVLRRRPQIET